MIHYTHRRIVLAVLLAVSCGVFALAQGKPSQPAEKTAATSPKRELWTASRVTGSPEPPPPFRTGRVYDQLRFENPVLITTAPGSDRFFVAEQSGRIFSFPIDGNPAQADLFVDLKTAVKLPEDSPHRGVGTCYGLTFHPKFQQNRYCYVTYVLSPKVGGQLPDGSRVARFKVLDTNPPTIDPDSEQVVITWLAGGHNGGCLEFGPDGCLYISTGDGSFPNPPDALLAGQDVSNLLSSILRIDVDHPSEGKAYTIPADNPFVDLPNARGEIWSYGFRNPWKITFDRKTGELWAGDVGWELYEMIYRIERGGNYGWSVMEGRQSVRPEAARGPTPIRPPMIDLPHSIAASVTGGYVYRGKDFPELEGAYIFGDWETRRMWAARFDGEKLTEMPEITDPTLRIVAYGEDHAGELYILDYDDGTVHRLYRNEPKQRSHDFPRKLSETGLFDEVVGQVPAPGVIPFDVNVPMWSDHATAQRFLGLPGDTSIVWHGSEVKVPGTIMKMVLEFPADAVLAKTLAIEMERGNPGSRRLVETQLLHFNGRVWNGYSYRWNAAQTDADLVPLEGLDAVLSIADAEAPGGRVSQTWHFPGRAECARCHNPWAQHTLAFHLAQLNRDVANDSPLAAYATGESRLGRNQLRVLEELGVLVRPAAEQLTDPHDVDVAYAELPQLTDPYDAGQSLTSRARSYLQVNCAHCHQQGAGGTADIELRHTFPLARTKAVNARPMQGTFEIHDARIIAPADPYRSILFYRMSKVGRGRMPHVGSEVIDARGVQLMHDWIQQLPARPDDSFRIERLLALDEPALLAREEERRSREIAAAALKLAQTRQRELPNEQDRTDAARQHEQQLKTRRKERELERIQLTDELLNSTSSALLLARELSAPEAPASIRELVVAAAVARPEVQIRDLFEPFLPEEKRAKRLGNVIRPEDLLALTGDAARGRELFLNSSNVQCKSCHKLGDAGKEVGPDLSQIGKKYDRPKLLESILEPSKFIDPKFQTWLVETVQGQVHSGLKVVDTPEEVVLRNLKGEDIRVPRKEIEQLVPQRQSLMPELLLRDMTAEQVADLLALLASLK